MKEMQEDFKSFYMKQCFRSGSDPDSIRSVDPYPRRQNWPAKREKK
jgi:hypothetical protein